MSILLFSCTKLENEIGTEVENRAPFEMCESSSEIFIDSLTKTRIVSFVKHHYNSRQSTPNYEREWDKISAYGEISFDNLKLFRSDSSRWYYLLPIKDY